MIRYLAMIAAWAGDKDLAYEQLAVAIRPPSRLTYGQLKLLPFWDPLRGDPRFEKIVASLAPKLAASLGKRGARVHRSARATRNCGEDPGRPIIRRSPLQFVLGFFAR